MTSSPHHSLSGLLLVLMAVTLTACGTDSQTGATGSDAISSDGGSFDGNGSRTSADGVGGSDEPDSDIRGDSETPDFLGDTRDGGGADGDGDATDNQIYPCSMFNGELCCTDDGPVTAMCHSPSQPFCEDGSTPQTSCPDAPVDETGTPVTCANVQTLFADYIAAHNSCTTVEDCARIGGTMSCDCARSLGPASGAGVRKDAVTGTNVYFQVFGSEACKDDGPKICDADAGDISCTDGACVVGNKNCGLGF